MKSILDILRDEDTPPDPFGPTEEAPEGDNAAFEVSLREKRKTALLKQMLGGDPAILRMLSIKERQG